MQKQLCILFLLVALLSKSTMGKGGELHLSKPAQLGMHDRSMAYPNPFSDFTTLSYKAESSGMVKISLFTAQGRMISEIFNDLVDEGSVYQFLLDGSSLPSGVYWCSIETEKRTKQQRLEIIR